ncbi:annexin A13-like [Microplitis mediator]|uniref:annexin A13-like n=1 Tax=Microplitis mediator TaxID=375433 RepID=UPI002553F5DA|nr:annexin A13-like [Microplitis mediator]
MAQSLINVIKIFLPIIISGNVLVSACSIKVSSVRHSSSNVPVFKHPHGFIRSAADVDRLRDAIMMDDRSEIINIFIIKNLNNRQSLHEEYLNKYGSELRSLCQSKLSGDFGHLITSLATPPLFFLANELHYFLQSFRRDHSTLEEVFRYHDADKIREAYQSEYGVEVQEHYRKLPYSVRQRLERLTPLIDRTYYSGSIELADDQANYYRIKLVEAKNKLDARHFTRLIVMILNDRILDKVRMTYRYVYGEPLASITDELPEGDYLEAISTILSPPGSYGDDAIPNPDYYKIIIPSYSF